MALFKTKYPNTSRKVSGTPTLFNDDVVLLCSTLLGPVTINLLEIPDDFWNTNWKLYVIDVDGNAAVNNITINAGTGQLVNSVASIVLDTDNGGALIQIASNYAFLASKFIETGLDEKVKITATDTTTNFLDSKLVAGTGITFTTLNPGANEQIQIDSSATGDEKVKVTATDTTTNFLDSKLVAGTGINFTTLNAGANEQIQIDSPAVTTPIISTTNATFKTFVTASTLSPNTIYLITDALFTTGGVYIRALTSNTHSREGRGIFLNIDWQDTTGNFLGVWDITLTGLVSGASIVAWNGQSYGSLTGANGSTAPDVDTTNWSLETRVGKPSIYVQEIDWVLYNVLTNEVTLRKDKRQNTIENFEDKGASPYNSLNENEFQWGYDKVTANSATLGGVFRNANWDSGATGQFEQNIATTGAYVNAISSGNNFIRNTLSNGATMDLTENRCKFVGNIVDGGTVTVTRAPVGEFYNNTVINGSILLTTMVSGNIHKNYVRNGSITGASLNVTTLQNNEVIDGTLNVGSALGVIDDNKVGIDCVLDVQFATTVSVVQYNILRNGSLLTATTNAGTITHNTLNNVAILTCLNNVASTLCNYNIIESGSILVNLLYTNTSVEKNKVGNACIISCTAMTARSAIASNILESGSSITCNNAAGGTITYNYLSNGSRIDSDLISGSITKNTLEHTCSILSASNVGIITNNILSNGGSISAPTNTGNIGTSGLNNGNYIEGSEISVTTNGGDIAGCNLSQDSKIDIATKTANLLNFTMSGSGILIVTTQSANMTNCVIVAGSIRYTTVSTAITLKSRQTNFCNWETIVDMSDATQYSSNRITLSVIQANFGVLLLENASGKIIDRMTPTSFSSDYDVRLVNNDSSGNCRVTSTAVATANDQNFIQTGGAANNNLYGRAGVTPNSDNLVVGKVDTDGSYQIRQINIFS